MYLEVPTPLRLAIPVADTSREIAGVVVESRED